MPLRKVRGVFVFGWVVCGGVVPRTYLEAVSLDRANSWLKISTTKIRSGETFPFCFYFHSRSSTTVVSVAALKFFPFLRLGGREKMFCSRFAKASRYVVDAVLNDESNGVAGRSPRCL